MANYPPHGSHHRQHEEYPSRQHEEYPQYGQREPYPPPQGRRDHPAPPQGQTCKVFCKVDKTFNLAIRNETPVMVPANSQDPTQLWIKDLSYGERIKDNFGFPAFVLVNRGTNKILKHGKQKGHQLYLVDYQPSMVEEDVLFSESQDMGEGFKTLRMASDTTLNATLFQPEEKKSLFHSSKPITTVKEGTPLVLDVWHQNEASQLWKIFSF